MTSLAGTTIYLHGFGPGIATLRDRARMRKTCGPYQWRVSAVDDRQARKGRGYYAGREDGTPSAHDATFYLRACERPAKFAHGWFCDEFQDQTISPVVLRLPRGRGFLAGWTMGANMASSIDFDVYDDERSAWFAADSMAEQAAEREREYQENNRDDEGEE